MAYPLVIRLMIAMTLMPDASYCEALGRLAGLLADIPFATEWHVPAEKVVTGWRLLVPTLSKKQAQVSGRGVAVCVPTVVAQGNASHIDFRREELPLMPPADPVTVESPKHPLHALTTFELRDYRHQLERAIAFCDGQDPMPPARAGLQARLDAVLAEQDERARLAHA